MRVYGAFVAALGVVLLLLAAINGVILVRGSDSAVLSVIAVVACMVVGPLCVVAGIVIRRKAR